MAPDAANCPVNVVVGLVVAVFDGLDMVSHLTDGQFGGEFLMVTTMTVVALVIAWLGWRLPAPEAATVGREGARTRS